MPIINVYSTQIPADYILPGFIAEKNRSGDARRLQLRSATGKGSPLRSKGCLQKVLQAPENELCMAVVAAPPERLGYDRSRYGPLYKGKAADESFFFVFPRSWRGASETPLGVTLSVEKLRHLLQAFGPGTIFQTRSCAAGTWLKVAEILGVKSHKEVKDVYLFQDVVVVESNSRMFNEVSQSEDVDANNVAVVPGIVLNARRLEVPALFNNVRIAEIRGIKRSFWVAYKSPLLSDLADELCSYAAVNAISYATGIFIVHGRASSSKGNDPRDLKTYLSRHLPHIRIVVLQDEFDGISGTVYEKYTRIAKGCSHAIILMTRDEVRTILALEPDLSSAETRETLDSLRLSTGRPRQNVVFETGWFCATIGIGRVAVLKEKGCGGFSDLGGYEFIPYEPPLAGAAQAKRRIMKQCKAWGFEWVD